MMSLEKTLRHQRLIAFFIPLLLSAPFINRAFFVDDSYFVQIATWLKDNPSKPYDFTADDAAIGNHGWEKDGFVRMVNPLVHQYYLAALMKVAGARIWVLRFGTVLLTGFAAVFVFELARRWTDHGLFATLLTAASPPYWLTAHSLLIDSTMGFFFVGALFFFIRCSETGDWSSGALSGVFMGLAMLSKYTAALIFPLTAVWFVLKWKKVPAKLPLFLAWVIGAGALIAYSVWTAKLYGRPHILAASSRMVGHFGWPKLAMLAIFLSGACLTPLAGWVGAPRWLIVVGVALGTVLTGLFFSSVGGFPLVSSVLLGLWIATSAVFLIRTVSDAPAWVWPRDAFLAAWILGFVAMMLVVMDWVAVRYYHIVAPAAAIAAVRVFERRGESATRWIAWSTLFVFVFTALLGYADYQQAEPARRIGAILHEQGFEGGPRHFYLGDSFTMSYLRDDGWVPAFASTTFQPGDLVLSKEVTMPLVWFVQKRLPLRAVATYDFPTWFPIKVMDFRASAGFYASVWGALPFTWSTGPWERFRLYEVQADEHR